MRSAQMQMLKPSIIEHSIRFYLAQGRARVCIVAQPPDKLHRRVATQTSHLGPRHARSCHSCKLGDRRTLSLSFCRFVWHMKWLSSSAGCVYLALLPRMAAHGANPNATTAAYHLLFQCVVLSDFCNSRPHWPDIAETTFHHRSSLRQTVVVAPSSFRQDLFLFK